MVKIVINQKRDSTILIEFLIDFKNIIALFSSTSSFHKLYLFKKMQLYNV